MPNQHICVVGFKVLRNFYANCGKSVQPPLQSVKLIYQSCSRSRAAYNLTWLINLKIDLNHLWLFLVALLSTNHKCAHHCLLLLRRESWCEVFRRWCWVLGVRSPKSIACEVWSLHFQNKLYNSDSLLIVLFSFLHDTVTDYSLIMFLYVWNLIMAYI